jgi:hypothetical protein
MQGLLSPRSQDASKPAVIVERLLNDIAAGMQWLVSVAGAIAGICLLLDIYVAQLDLCSAQRNSYGVDAAYLC